MPAGSSSLSAEATPNDSEQVGATGGVAAQRFLPFRRADIISMCAGERRLEGADEQAFLDVCAILEAILHYEYHLRLEALKQAYAPFDPDADTRCLKPAAPSERDRSLERFSTELRALLDAANYDEVAPADIDRALRTQSLLKVRLQVDLSAFEEVALFRRGESVRSVEVSGPLGFRRRTLSFHNYDRVVVFVRYGDERGATMLKLFRDVPRPDLETLLPNGEVRMRRVDKLTMGVPAVAGAVIVVVTKLLASLGLLLVLIAFWLGLSNRHVHLDRAQLIALGAGVASVAGYMLRQVSKFKNRKILFMKALAENLYFKNLDNNAGVFHTLLDAAEEEDHKEAVLAYWFLLSGGPATSDSLDEEVERWFAERWDCPVDFEVADALAKLDRFGLASCAEGTWSALGPESARALLDDTWDGYFSWGTQSRERSAHETEPQGGDSSRPSDTPTG